jgi:hypothetical protein
MRLSSVAALRSDREQVSPDIGLYFRVREIKSVLYIGPLLDLYFFTFFLTEIFFIYFISASVKMLPYYNTFPLTAGVFKLDSSWFKGCRKLFVERKRVSQRR